MKHTKDERINVGLLSFKKIAINYVISLGSFFCLLGIYRLAMLSSARAILIPALIFLTLFVVALISALQSSLSTLSVYGKPVRAIADAARRVTQGDFSVRVPSFRKDGKKDEIEVLIEDFNRMVEELGTIETLKTDFIANVSHEVKAPLSVIQAYATVIQDEDLSLDKRRECGKVIVEASKRLSDLVTNILKMNKFENQEILLDLQDFALDEQLRECVLAFEEVWDKKNITFEADIPECTIHEDAALLELVWNNLISNAIKFTAEGGTVTLTLRREDGFVLVTVADTGCGMADDTVTHIFDKFYQGDPSRATDGNGLGLPLVKKILDSLGGEISVVSRPGEGTAITVKLKN